MNAENQSPKEKAVQSKVVNEPLMNNFIGKDKREYDIEFIEEYESRMEQVIPVLYVDDVAQYKPIIAIIRYEGTEIGEICIEEKWFKYDEDPGEEPEYFMEYCKCDERIRKKIPSIGSSGCGCIHGEIKKEHRRNGIGTFVIEQLRKLGYEPCPDEECGEYGEGWVEFWKSQGYTTLDGDPIEEYLPSY